MKVKYIVSKDKRSKQFNIFVKKHCPEFLREKDPDAILVSGGDGAMLHAIQDFKNLNIPFIGRACGTLNYFMNSIEDDISFLKQLKSGEIEFDSLNTKSIKVSIRRVNGKVIDVGQAVNDISIGTSIMGYHKFELSSKDKSFNKFQVNGTGLIISTALGSTAYNFNAGGKILPLESPYWSVVGLACNKYVNDILTIQHLEIKLLSDREGASLFLDAIKSNISMKQTDTMILEPGDEITMYFKDLTQIHEKRTSIVNRYRLGF